MLQHEVRGYASLSSSRSAAGQLHPVRSDRAPEDVVRRWLIRRLERAEQAVPDRGADAKFTCPPQEFTTAVRSGSCGDPLETILMMKASENGVGENAMAFGDPMAT